MTGSLTADGEPVLPVHISGPAGAVTVDAMIDTGFNGELTLPQTQIEALGLSEAIATEVTLADGRTRDVPLYDATAKFDESSRAMFVTKAPTSPLLGTSLLWEFSLCIDFEVDETVEVAPLSS